MSYAVHRQTLAPEQPIRYAVADEAGGPLYTVERTNPLFDLSRQPVRFLSADGSAVAELIPPEERNLWRAINTYQIMLAGEERPHYTIEQTYSLVDRILLRSPRYKLRSIGGCYVARGSRHGEHFYELFDGQGHYLGQIVRPSRGPTYLIESDVPALMQMPLLLAALTVVIDLELAAIDV